MLMDELLAKYRDQMIAPTATGQASSMPQMPRKDYIGAIGKKPKVSRIFDKEQINTAGTLGGAGLASMARLLQTWNNVDATNESEAIKDYEDRLKHAMDLDKSQETMQHKLDFEGLSPNDAAEREYKGAATDRIRQDMAFDAEKHPLEMDKMRQVLSRGATTHGGKGGGSTVSNDETPLKEAIYMATMNKWNAQYPDSPVDYETAVERLNPSQVLSPQELNEIAANVAVDTNDKKTATYLGRLSSTDLANKNRKFQGLKFAHKVNQDKPETREKNSESSARGGARGSIVGTMQAVEQIKNKGFQEQPSAEEKTVNGVTYVRTQGGWKRK